MFNKSIMEESNPNEESPDFYIALSSAAISQQQYKEALLILREGLEKSLKSERRADIRKLLRSFYALVATLNVNLEEAYGDDWEGKVDIPKVEEKEIRCSFCGKAPGEVAQIIAGPAVYICNECISICNEIISDRN
jgi:hypothetical protein